MTRLIDRRNTRLAEVVLLGIAILGLLYLGDRVIGSSVFSSTHSVSVQLPSGGGIYPGADVTYRGSTIGRVDDVELEDDGVVVKLHIKGKFDVPTDTEAVVSNLSAIGEQRLDFRPRTDHGPYLRDGDVVSRANSAVPRRFDTIIRHLGDVAGQIDEKDLTTITSELGTGLDTEVDLATLGRDADNVVSMLELLAPKITHLTTQAQVPLRTVVDTGDDLRSFAANIDLVTAQLEKSDAQIRRTLSSTATLTPILASTIQELTAPLTSTVKSWNVFARLGDDRLPGYQHWLTWAPKQFYAMSDATRDGSGHVLLAANFGDNCEYGPPRVNPYVMTHDPAPLDARCTREDPGVQQRGAQYAPRLPGDPVP
ncbi:phospholipid/cholesterol/gamma-HCH transport system substrate-binding protein [Aeromicrobium panaciterrae]|uniref:Phospholipid/cholesterol/gamma-HCH transport system substrate-binding protein n=1 Tax=Aeromicrobium panaciterrae TaxID=363861 RepID=A0ABU1URH4_9ACTN|nr:MlaD family protein [Aeromicrobium panaciterrae]MDR7087791.1 phospholipid/cholesterol/gamma-HCH transport system substrate-binding protein [Aeromicrobium panaciterrae]